MSDVRVSRHGRALLLAGATTRYALEPRGDYVFGIVCDRPMRAGRGSSARASSSPGIRRRRTAARPSTARGGRG